MYDLPTKPLRNDSQWRQAAPGLPMTPHPPRRPQRSSCRYVLLGTGGCLLLLVCILGSVLTGIAFLPSFTFHSAPQQPSYTPPYDEASTFGSTPKDTVYRVMGKPTLTPAFINLVLARNDSPASGKGQALYDYGVQYGVDPAYALAFFWQESHFGKLGVAQETHSLGNIRQRPDEPAYQGYRLYKTWEEGFEDWYRLIAQTYVQGWGLATVDQIIPTYAPRKDNNDEASYILTVKVAVDKWRTEISPKK